MAHTLRGSSWRAVVILALLAPYIVAFTPSPEDSTWTTISVAGGSGSYAHVSRDCSGKVLDVEDMPYNDVAIGMEHVTPTLTYGVRGGYFHANAESRDGFNVYPAQSSSYLNPYVGKDWPGAAFHLGIIAFDNSASGAGDARVLKWNESAQPTVDIRIGGRPGIFFSTSFLSNMPLGTGGGVFDIGLGSMPESGGSFWVGMAFLPYEEGALAAKIDIPLLTNLSVSPRFQIRGGDATEYGVSIGLSGRF